MAMEPERNHTSEGRRGGRGRHESHDGRLGDRGRHDSHDGRLGDRGRHDSHDGRLGGRGRHGSDDVRHDGRGEHGSDDGRRGGRGRHAASESRPDRGANCAQTFRRGRAIAFLERLEGMRATLAKQLREPEFESIRPVISGELKAVDTVIQAFVQTFELREQPADDREPERTDTES